MPTQREKPCTTLTLVKQFLTEHGGSRSIEYIPAVGLNNYLGKFIFAARTKKGKEYEPSSLIIKRKTSVEHFQNFIILISYNERRSVNTTYSTM